MPAKAGIQKILARYQLAYSEALLDSGFRLPRGIDSRQPRE